MKRILVLCFILLLACENQQDDAQTQLENTKLSLKLNNPPNEVSYVVAVIEHSTDGSILTDTVFVESNSASIEFEHVQPGNWNLDVAAYNDTDVKIYEGSTVVTVNLGTTTQANLNLNPINGSISITITWGTSGEDQVIAYYPFIDNANDATAFSHNGVVNGALLTTDRYGNPNQAYSFDGIDDVITINDSPEFSTETISISAWINMSSREDGTYYTIVSQLGANWASDQTAFTFQVYQDGRLAFALRRQGDAVGRQKHSTSIINTNVWYHVVGVYDGNDIRVYLNGVEENGLYDGPIPGALNDAATPITIGKTSFDFTGWRQPFAGSIDDVRIYNYDIDANEVLNLYSSGLLAYYPFSGNANDAVGNNDGVVIGATLTTDRFGNSSSAYYFDGNDYIVYNTLDTLSFDAALNSYTISLWVKSSAPGLSYLVDKWDGNVSQDYPFAIRTGDSIAWAGIFDNQISNPIQLFGNVWDDSWHLLTFVVDHQSETRTIYVDDMFINSISTAGIGPTANSHLVNLGRATGVENRYYTGAVDELRFYNRALEHSDVISLFNN